MSSHLVFNGVNDAVKARLESYWAQKLPRLQKLLIHYPAELPEIRLTVTHHRRDSKDSRYEVRGVIRLPTGTLAAEAEDEDPQVAVDRVAGTLVQEIKRHKELVRKDYLYKRKARNRADLGATGPLLERDVEHGRREDFFRLLRPHLHFLREHARRELRMLEQNGTLHRRELTVDDLLGDVMTLAWERFADRPRHLPLDLWLTNLLHNTVERWIQQEPRPHGSLEAIARDDEASPEGEEEWWTELLGDMESLTLGDLIPDAEGTDTWEQLDADAQRDRLLALINELPPLQRQAFLLHALENYDAVEIAMLQDRPESQVKADIATARQTLRERMLAGGLLKKAARSADARQKAAGPARDVNPAKHPVSP